MPLTEDKKKEYMQRILYSRLRILNEYGFYGLLLMHMRFGIDEKAETAYTDGYRLCFGPAFLDRLSNSELDFIMMHEIMHVALKHCFRGRTLDPRGFNIACDIVVNSNILQSHNMDLRSITLSEYGESMHKTPDGREGYLFSAEEVYNMLPKSKGKVDVSKLKWEEMDDHSQWGDSALTLEGGTGGYIDEWEARLIQAAESCKAREAATGRDTIPLGVLRMIGELTDSTVDWRKLLNDFISFEVNDYSFMPPDRRFQGDFFLPDFNEPEEVVSIDILFEIDTSGSMTDDDIQAAYSEIKGAIDFGNGRLRGWLGFYDAEAYKPEPFSSVEDILSIRPVGGGGTSCRSVFRCLDRFADDIGKLPDAIIFLTDGYDEFPSEEVRQNIPVFWLINNEQMTPPWGIVARMKPVRK